MAAAGALVAIGVLVLAVDRFDDARAVAVMLSVALVIGGYLVLGKLMPELAPAGVVFVAVGAGAVAPFAMLDDTTTSMSGILAVTTVFWSVTTVVPLTRGRPFLVGLTLAGAWLLLVELASDEVAITVGSLMRSSDSASYLSLIIGAGLLAAAWAFDRRQQHALATPFVAVGDLATVVGAIAVASDLSDVGGSLLVIGAGAGLGIVGHLGLRRLTTWLGAALVAGGVAAFVGAVIGDDAEPVTIAVALAAAGVGLAGIMLAIARRAEPVDHFG